MSRRRKDPLRVLTEQERHVLEQISRSFSEPASHVARSNIILAVAHDTTYAEAAKTAGRKARQSVSKLISRLNQEGIAAIEPGHGGRPRPIYAPAEGETAEVTDPHAAPNKTRSNAPTQSAGASVWPPGPPTSRSFADTALSGKQLGA